MGKNNTGGAQVGRLPFEPFKRDITLEINRTQGENNIINGQVALTHHFVNHFSVFNNAVLDMGILYVTAEILHRRFRFFIHKPVRVMDIPERAYRVAFNPV
jgi:hypothetical protein